ncbi:hypothetical protein GDO86_004607 [Hymenochirus boettgeri]|uniref:Uncharacterized protein n=1 Tax=Hymenochirus boettgeri TaxID=247094 RepID=A0A8T2K9E9_9PIPI|nr:hypothetical protein GDO86_004607 [Hymenochirus boettgeri]
MNIVPVIFWAYQPKIPKILVQNIPIYIFEKAGLPISLSLVLLYRTSTKDSLIILLKGNKFQKRNIAAADPSADRPFKGNSHVREKLKQISKHIIKIIEDALMLISWKINICLVLYITLMPTLIFCSVMSYTE